MWSEVANKWSWFCQDANTSSENEDPKEFDGEPRLSECSVNFSAFILHLVFVIIAFLMLLSKRWCFLFNRVTSPYLLRWPGHITRWIVTILMIILALISLGEGFLTEMARKESNTQLQFYLPACLLLVASIVALYYYTLAESWTSPGLLWLLLAYWFFCIAVNIMRLMFLIQDNVDVTAAILWINILMLVSYVCFFGLELRLIYMVRLSGNSNYCNKII